ncbi:uncharacterized protein LOC119190089 [Manduca sexta]|uniref:uncharacterized protein LOC119190089 n=1 Tax=Manduca sexta TaxID=7130 RepID=UPI00188F0A4E|nr:uncharacterized protein LOC119190089 [Manduca sexta]
MPAALARGITYAAVLKQIQQKVDLASLDIAETRARLMATGGYLYEVPRFRVGPRPDSETRANTLADKMREVFCGTELEEDVRISRPFKTADLRISGLDPSSDPEMVAAALAKAGNGAASDFKVGEIRPDHSGLGAVWARCPAKVADKIVRAKRVLIGWVAAQVRLLEPRPMRCFRCLLKGHVRMRCTEEYDRSGICYRCGQEGHKAKGCSASPHCVICAAASKPAGHHVGAKACVASSRPRRVNREGGIGVVTPPDPSHRETAMEIAH